MSCYGGIIELFTNEIVGDSHIFSNFYDISVPTFESLWIKILDCLPEGLLDVFFGLREKNQKILREKFNEKQGKFIKSLKDKINDRLVPMLNQLKDDELNKD